MPTRSTPTLRHRSLGSPPDGIPCAGGRTGGSMGRSVRLSWRVSACSTPVRSMRPMTASRPNGSTTEPGAPRARSATAWCRSPLVRTSGPPTETLGAHGRCAVPHCSTSLGSPATSTGSTSRLCGRYWCARVLSLHRSASSSYRSMLARRSTPNLKRLMGTTDSG